MAITNFIPTIWSENLYSALDKQYVAVAHCNREYEGEIKNKGSVVKICGVGNISVDDYTKDTDMSSPQALSDTVAELNIDQAKYFNFQIDDIDRAQCTPKLMDAAMKVAASSLANEADKYVFGLARNVNTMLRADVDNITDVINTIIKARQRLYENNVTDMDSVVFEVSPAIASAILKSKMSIPFCEAAVVETGYLGSIAGCKIYVSNNVIQEDGGMSYIHHYCLMRTTRAIAFAEQFSEIDAYRPEKRFADAVKGLHLYGAKIVYPGEIVCLNFGVHVDNM